MSGADSDAPLLTEQVEYYRARAAEYDDWFRRRGRYDRGPEHTRTWAAETGEVEAALRAEGPHRRVLELACGTGLWTRHLVAQAQHLTAVDASPEVLAINRARLADAGVAAGRTRHVEADLFRWRPTEAYDFVFFGFWLSHVPDTHFGDFWRLVRSCLAPGGRAFLVDSLFAPESTARDHELLDTPGGVQERKLDDGRRFRVVKVFHEPAKLTARLASLGFTADIRRTERFFLYGHAASSQRCARP